ncbi:MAG: Putative photosynthetic complex assembly protein [uncultured Microvirga sp.]|uniref:Photosynthetic complex assembly protein n=1 Tax=uncultured Microvirga sp. TaxID=412392 RepID=A0A6J4MKW5_9HYPH|nr:MAG: Putative photosynthetic complex assembly protein [uncultured Microvirga sp.]
MMQFGIALPMSVNVPFAIVGSAALKPYSDGTGDIPLALSGDKKIPYVLLWPHARPWRVSRVEPMLRALPDAREVAEVLKGALAAAAPVAARAGVLHPEGRSQAATGTPLASAA